MVRYIRFTAYLLGIMEMTFLAIVLLDISLPSPKYISNLPPADSAPQHASHIEKNQRASSSETVVWLNMKDNNP
jgi:hypothetical protein